MSGPLSPLPLGEWRETRDRLHGWARLCGAVRRQRSPRRKHWWHIGLLPCARGGAVLGDAQRHPAPAQG